MQFAQFGLIKHTMDMTASDFRRAHLIRQIERYGNAESFAEAAGLAPSYVSQLKTGKRNIGTNTARKIEAALGLDHGSMDIPPPAHKLDEELAALLAEMPEMQAIKLIADSIPHLSRTGVQVLTAALLERIAKDQ